MLPSTIAAARHTDIASEFYSLPDLFAISGTTLYRFAPDKQQDSAVAQPIVANDIFSDTSQLYAMTLGGVTTRKFRAL